MLYSLCKKGRNYETLDYIGDYDCWSDPLCIWSAVGILFCQLESRFLLGDDVAGCDYFFNYFSGWISDADLRDYKISSIKA
jgi:hypothetical protein